MDARTLEDLKASIAKWERNANAETPDEYLTSVYDCPLCALFIDGYCRNCPVADRTGVGGCEDTPYRKASVARASWAFFAGSRKEARAAASAEVAFLKSLLPPEEAP